MHFGNQQREVVQEAPGPLLARLERADERVAAASTVCARVSVGRVVTTADLAALEADPQMNPSAARCEAVDASVDGLRQVGNQNVLQMVTRGH